MFTWRFFGWPSRSQNITKNVALTHISDWSKCALTSPKIIIPHKKNICSFTFFVECVSDGKRCMPKKDILYPYSRGSSIEISASYFSDLLVIIVNILIRGNREKKKTIVRPSFLMKSCITARRWYQRYFQWSHVLMYSPTSLLTWKHQILRNRHVIHHTT